MQVSKKEAFQDYISPVTGNPLDRLFIEEGAEGLNGALYDKSGRECVPIRNSIPRFIARPIDSPHLKRYRRVPLDSYNSSSVMRDRFFADTHWTPEALEGKRVLEIGCRTGHFSEIVLATGAQLYSLDTSTAVDAAWLNNRHRPNWTLCQADIYGIPFERGWFDYIFCYGVLPYTPDPRRAFLNLARFLKPDGKIAVDAYLRQPRLNRQTAGAWRAKAFFKHLYRLVTPQVDSKRLLRLLESYVPWWMPIDSILQQIPGPLAGIVPCWNMADLPIPAEDQQAWTILATFEALTTTYDHPLTLETMQAWFAEAELANIHVRRNGNGLLGNARKAPNQLAVL
jgi:SAM-dependent methyltransferase